jgi:hypothetical protein
MEVESMVSLPEVPVLLLGTRDGRILTLLIGRSGSPSMA